METILNILLIIGVNLVLFGRTIWYDLILDDTRRFTYPQYKVSKWVKLLECLHTSRHYKVNKKIEHALSLGIHTLCCVLVYLCLGKNLVSLMAAILFSVNPTNTQVSVWLNGKRYGINAILCLLMFKFSWAIVLYPFTLYWQIGAVFYPIMALFKGQWWVLLIVPFAALYFFKIKVMGHNTTMLEIFKQRFKQIKNTDLDKASVKKLVILVKSVFFYFLHSLIPYKCSFYYTFMDNYGLSKRTIKEAYKLNHQFWGGISILIIILTLIGFNFSNPLGLGLFWWLLFILQWCGYPWNLAQMVTDRYCYLPNIGLMLALSYAISLTPISTILYTIFITYYAVVCIRYTRSYKNIEQCFRNVLHEFPEQTRARQSVVKLNMENAKHDLFARHNSLVECAEGLRYSPFDHELNCCMFLILKTFGYLPQARAHLKRAEQHLVPGYEKIQLAKIAKWKKDLPPEVKK